MIRNDFRELLPLLIVVILTLFPCETEAQEAQWRGPGRNGIYPDSGLLKQWPEGGPELILKKDELGIGYSSPVLVDGMIYITGKRGEKDVLTCMDLSGEIAWETVYGSSWENSFPETRVTPTIEDGRVYLTGGMGKVVSIDASSGEVVWEVNTHEAFEGEFHRWGMVESLLVTEEAVISSPIGNRTAVVALDKNDGSLIWESASVGGTRSYASPLMIDHNGQKLILALSPVDLIIVEPGAGKVLSTYDLIGDHTERDSRNIAATPVYHNGEIFVTSGYNDECLMLSMNPDGNETSLKWSNGHLDNHHGGVVLVDGYLYGSNWINNGNGNWVCMDWNTGEAMYEEKWHNKGSIIYADGRLYLFEEKRGNVGLVQPGPEEFRVISSFRIEDGTGPYWAHPTIYDRKLLIRHGEVLFVYDISAE